jgi:hypothetical protein
MEKTLKKEDGTALPVEIDSLLRKVTPKDSTSSKSSKKSSKPRIPKSQSLRSSKKPSLVSPNNTKRDQTNADIRLNEFMCGKRSILVDGQKHYYDPEEGRQYTLEEIGSAMGVTRERVRQVEEMGLRKMWRAFDSMSRRENITPDEWMQILTDSHAGEDTVYIPS